METMAVAGIKTIVNWKKTFSLHRIIRHYRLLPDWSTDKRRKNLGGDIYLQPISFSLSTKSYGIPIPGFGYEGKFRITLISWLFLV